jgi:hypothetical protein
MQQVTKVSHPLKIILGNGLIFPFQTPPILVSRMLGGEYGIILWLLYLGVILVNKTSLFHCRRTKTYRRRLDRRLNHLARVESKDWELTKARLQRVPGSYPVLSGATGSRGPERQSRRSCEMSALAGAQYSPKSVPPVG